MWTTLITNTAYLSGLLTLDYSLKQAKTKYPLIALYTDAFPEEGHKALDLRGIPKQRIKYLLPSKAKDFVNDPRFYDCWSKLTPFSLEQYDRVVQLDSDMLILQNMDELMDVELDSPSMKGKGERVFAAAHACVCNPMKKPHYPKDWIPENCAYTMMHSKPEEAQVEGAPVLGSMSMPNGGLQVVNPSKAVYDSILQRLADSAGVDEYEFADQSLLSDVFRGRWVPLPYKYNALKTLRLPEVHGAIWRDENVKNIHYILAPKPWEETLGNESFETHTWWLEMNAKRRRDEEAKGIKDVF